MKIEIHTASDATALIPEKTAVLNARVHKIKRSGRLVFVYLAVRGEIIKTVYIPGVCEKDVSLLNEGTFIRARLSAAAEIKADNGVELRITDFEALSSPAAPYPIKISDAEYGYSLETAMEQKPLAMRHPLITAIYKTQSDILGAFDDYMRETGFTRVIVPIISSFSEKPSFGLDYFGKSAVLSHSPQLYMTAATAALDRVYCVSPSFLAKQYNSTRHLNEFTSLNFQLGYIDGVEDIIETLTGFLRRASEFGKDVSIAAQSPVYTFPDALSILGKPDQVDLDPTDIKRLCEYEKQKSGTDFVCVKGFPPDKRPFYAEDYANFDMYVNGLKIASGSMNFHDYAAQLEKAKRLGIKLSDYAAYDDALKYGVMPYGGCIIGLERLTAALLRLDSVKQTSLFARDLHHLKP